MGNDVLSMALGRVRGTDTNSLLRMYDIAVEISGKATSQHERLRADKAMQRIAKELLKRKVMFSAVVRAPL
jgi:hypothetical protein